MDIKTAIYRYCNYQERSHKEVKDKLYELGTYTADVNQLMAELLELGLLNEERFATAFARGRFKIKHWGRLKITYHLKQYGISTYLQKKALKEIDLNEYYAMANHLALRKWNSLRSGKIYVRRNMVFRYLQQKGYESSIINEILRDINTVE